MGCRDFSFQERNRHQPLWARERVPEMSAWVPPTVCRSLTTVPLQMICQWSTGRIDRNHAVNLTVPDCGRVSVSPRPCPFKEKPRSGPLVAKVFPCLSDSSQGWICTGPDLTSAYTRFNPTGPRRDA